MGKRKRETKYDDIDNASPSLLLPVPPCPLCASACSSSPLLKSRDNKRYYSCSVCHGVFMHPEDRLSEVLEKERYDNHNNSDISDPGYRKFLDKLLDPLLLHLRESVISRPNGVGMNTGGEGGGEEGGGEKGEHTDTEEDMHAKLNSLAGLDFGSGPFPSTQSLMQERHCNMKIFDPFYAPDAEGTVLVHGRYDYITCIETAEHFYDPRKEFQLLSSLLRESDGAALGVMTSFIPPAMRSNVKAFDDWYYRRDPAHVFFYSEETMRYICDNIMVGGCGEGGSGSERGETVMETKTTNETKPRYSYKCNFPEGTKSVCLFVKEAAS